MRSIVILAAALLLATPAAFAEPALSTNLMSVLGLYPDPAEADEPAARARFTSLAYGDTLEGTVLLAGDAVAKQGYTVTSVVLFADGHRLGKAKGTTDWTYALDTTLLGDGPHELAVRAMATPTRGAGQPSTGAGQDLLVHTENGVEPIVLFDIQAEFIGAQEARWTHKLAQDVSNLRVRVTELGVDGEYTLAYSEDASERPLEEWRDQRVHYDGEEEGSLAVTNDDVLEAPGLLTLEGAFVGAGRVRILVDAVPAVERAD